MPPTPAIEIRLLDHDQVRDLIARLWSTCRSLAQTVEASQLFFDGRCGFCGKFSSPAGGETGRGVHQPDCIALLAFNVLHSPADILQPENALDVLLTVPQPLAPEPETPNTQQ